MATTKSKTEVVTQAAEPFAVATQPDYIKSGPGRGSENVGADDMLVPRLEIVQSQSPIKDADPDARDGDLFNSVTSEILGPVAYFCPIYYQMEYILWKSKDEGGGFFGSFRTMEEAEKRMLQAIEEGEKPEFMEIVDTPVHYGLLVDPDTKAATQIVISMAKTKAKISRKWNSIIQIAGGDRFARIYKISTFTDENKKGQKFKNYVVAPAGFAPKEVYELAEATYATFSKGVVRADHSSGNVDVGSVDRGEV
jgi:hypothetical protein